MTQLAKHRVGFIGAGQMATALATGLIDAGVTTSSLVHASDPVAESRERFAKATGASVTEDNVRVVDACDILFLAVKPQFMGDVLKGITESVNERHLVISIAAGMTLETLVKALGTSTRTVRVMPNTPCLVGASAAGFSIAEAGTAEDAALVKMLLSTVGLAFEVPERQLDAVTGLSGSGPAYAYQMIEALSDGGVRMGLPRDVATKLAAQTLLGAAKMVLETGMHPGALKDAVTSPGGTTIAGVHALERNGLRAALMDAVEAATLRARELGQSS